MKVLDTIRNIFSGDNSSIDFTHVNSAIWVSVIMGMWAYKSWQSVGALCDFPPGVQLVLFTLIGAAPVSAGVNAARAIFTPASTQLQAPAPDDSGNAKP